jgi:hypothetical protein
VINVSIKADFSNVEKMLNNLQREQIPFATAYALTQTAKAAQREVQREIGRVFDRPTRYTENSVYVKPATKRKLVAEVKIQDVAKDSANKPVQWLIAEITGGARKLKGMEVLLQAKGQMPKGWYAVPTSFAPLDQYGNVSGGQINKILSQLQARNEYNLDKNETAKAKKARNSLKFRGKSRPSRYFAVVPGNRRTAHMQPGIWERVSFGFGSSVRPIFLYVQKAPRYRKRLDFERIVRTTADMQMPTQFKRGIALAMRTARPS